MKRNLKASFGLVALLAGAFALSACSGTWTVIFGSTRTPDISGKVLDAQTGFGLNLTNAKITLTNTTTGETDTSSGDTQGNWSIASADSGSYTIEVTEPGYFFTSFTAPFAYSSGSVTAPTIAGMDTANFAGLFAFILMWNTNQQLDLHMTWPATNISWLPSGVYANPAQYSTTAGFFMDSPAYQPKNADELSFWNQGFGPNGGYAGSGTTFSRTNRIEISKYSGTGNQTRITDTAGTSIVALDHTATSYGPTTIDVLREISYPSTYGMALNGGSLASVSYPYNLLTPASSVLLGVAELYADAPDTTTTNYISSSGTSGSNAVLYVVGPSTAGGSAALLGKFVVPTNIQLKTISLARVNITDTEYQIVPNIEAVTNGGFRALTNTSGNQVINIPFHAQTK